MRRLGLSVWAPTMRNPSWGSCPAAVAQATSVPPRTTNQRPGSPGQAASSARRVNPASASRAAAVAQAWYGDGEASQNASRRAGGVEVGRAWSPDGQSLQPSQVRVRGPAARADRLGPPVHS